ncbi:MAG: bifunctional 2-polyprenyl-6-hydroxyphenol methylase/3-demethylubiquinol 3-O-methyltransferase UbiG [Bdellovibrionales bacterium]|nr:bifunctional 2-polyprenyl-6-hydroxyphenol methylase/3-demethylubiquinol 3-O-methyltransferase UbiG [Bdellovibrionales bacterium]
MQKINNQFYDTYGDKWYTTHNDPVALLRAQAVVLVPWVIENVSEYLKGEPKSLKFLDIGCGAGFLSNPLAAHGYQVSGIDTSMDSLDVAKKHDFTGSVNYQYADAYHLPFEDQSFDVLVVMDFLEHIERPQDVIKEFARVLRPKGLFLFHTFNRNFKAYLLVIKFVEWFINNTPKDMHVLDLFIKPEELKEYCESNSMKVIKIEGIMPILSSIPIKNYFSGVVPENVIFKFSKEISVSYIGVAVKNTLFNPSIS